MIQFLPIKNRLNIFICLFLSTYFLVFMKEDFIHFTVNNSIIPLIYVKFISVCMNLPTVLSRPTFIILITKVSQDLAFVLWMPRAIDDTCGFGFILRMIYIFSPVLDSSLTHIGVIIWLGGFSSQFPTVTSTVVICPSIFLIRRLQYTFLNRFCYSHALKHVNIFLL